MHRNILLLALPILALLPSTLKAQTDPFDAVVNRALEVNPGVEARQLAIKSIVDRASADNYLPGAEVSFNHKWPGPGGSTRWGVEVSQGFDWPGLYGARRRLANEQRKAAKAEAQRVEAELALKTRLTLLQLIDARRRLALMEDMEQNMEQMTGFAQTLFDAGEATAIDLRKIRLERLAIRNQAAEIRAAVEAGQARLATLCSSAKEFAGGNLYVLPAISAYPASELPSLDVCIDNASRSAAGYVAISNVSEAEAALKVEKQKRAPGFALSYIHDFEEGVHYNGFGIGISLPAYGVGKSLTAARLELETQQLEYMSALYERLANVRALHAEAARLNQLRTEFDAELQAQNYVSLLNQSLEKRQMTMTDYLTELNYFIGLCLQREELELKFQTLLQQLSFPV